MPNHNSRKSSGSLADPLREPLRKQSHARGRTARRASEHERRHEFITPRNDLLPDLKIIQRAVTELIPYARRLRRFSLDDVIEAANVISSKGFLQPIFISRDGKTILDGELRFEAARWLLIFTES